MMILRPLKTVWLVCLVGFPVLAFWMGRLFLDASNRGKDMRSQGRFAQIEAMLLVYHEEHGAFPPTKYQPVAGGPMHSWRVLLVPHTDRHYEERYSKYDFSQEWNSPNNLQALGRMSPQFGYFRMDGDGNNDITHYLAIGGYDEWPSRKPLKSRLITKGKDRFLLVEYPESEIHWMEPKY